MQTEIGKGYAEAYSRSSLEQIATWARDHGYPTLKRYAQDAEDKERGSGRAFFADADRFAALAHAIAAILEPAAEPAVDQELAR